MRLKDAIASLQLGRKKEAEIRQLCTVWSEKADDGPQAVPLPEYPRPQMQRADWTCLNGWWEYGFFTGPLPDAGADLSPDGLILVPFSPETARSGVNRILQPGETLWYRRTVEDLHLPEGRRLILHFGAVDERCTVYWNGRKVGSHRNGYLSFSFDVTEYVKPGDNELKVFVWDDTDDGNECRGKQTLNPGGMFYHAQSGIWHTVWMETVPETYIRHMKITPLPEEEAVEVALWMSKDAEVCITVTDCAETFTYPLSSRLKVRIPVKNPRLWSPEHPELYGLRIEAGEDVVESYFAMRSFGVGMAREPYDAACGRGDGLRHRADETARLQHAPQTCQNRARPLVLSLRPVGNGGLAGHGQRRRTCAVTSGNLSADGHSRGRKNLARQPLQAFCQGR